ncbi:MAG: extracellular solute-binding protein [Candidatus Pacebacteria bacterium]|nr:extracellular solute-binding protein [Candidatus Paceibacterota bacterium]
MNSKKLMYILVGVISVAVLITIVLVLKNVGGSISKPVTLQFWGVFDDHNDFDATVKNFKSQNPGIDVKYQLFTFQQYESGFVNALAAGTGPDVLMIHNTWLPKHGDKLAPMPATGVPDTKTPFTLQNFKDQFVDVAYQDLVFNNQIYGMPLYTDTLGLYYNKDLFNSAGIARPPQTWDEVNSDVQLLTKIDKSNNVIQSGFSLGTARNINRSTDILMDMMIQSGAQMTSVDQRSASFSQNVNGQPVGQIALQYYTNFANPRNQNYSWNDSQHYSIDAFTEGTVAMMLGYAHDTQVIRSKAPRLNFAVAPMPQASISDVRNFANYWAVAVPSKSTNQLQAWKFVNYLSSKEGITSYLNATNRPSARRDLIDLQRSDPDTGVFAVQALSARSWFQADNTAIEGIFADMIDDVNFNRSSLKEAITRAESRVTVLMQR